MSLSDKALEALAGSVIIGIAGLMCEWHGYTRGQDNILRQQADAIAKYSAHTKKVTTEVVTVYKERVKTVYLRGDTIIKKVPVYVTKEDDARCTINTGFVRLWNSANQMSVPGPASPADGKASFVILSDVAAQHGAEAKLCHAKEEQLNSLQDWVDKQSRVH